VDRVPDGRIVQGYGLLTCTLDLSRDTRRTGRATVLEIERQVRQVREAVQYLLASLDRGPVHLGGIGMDEAAAPVLLSAAGDTLTLSAVACVDGAQPLTAPELHKVMAPTLLVAGSEDAVGLAASRLTMAQLHCSKRLEIIPGAKSAFDAPGAIETVGHLAGAWLATHLSRASRF
jgi:putative phosphoribosyl transferase